MTKMIPQCYDEKTKAENSEPVDRSDRSGRWRFTSLQSSLFVAGGAQNYIIGFIYVYLEKLKLLQLGLPQMCLLTVWKLPTSSSACARYVH